MIRQTRNQEIAHSLLLSYRNDTRRDSNDVTGSTSSFHNFATIRETSNGNVITFIHFGVTRARMPDDGKKDRPECGDPVLYARATN